jgi:DNA-3-methyladenine glycosylase
VTGSTGARARPAGLGSDFYDRPVVEVARDLLGCVLSHGETAGVIVETEAYHHSEEASHAYVGLTSRTSTLFGPPGIAYVYRSYGIHALINAVCEGEDVGAAVLLRALEPVSGLQLMRLRRSGVKRDQDLCSGPGKLTQALDIEMADNRSDLSSGPVRISAPPPGWERPAVVADRRIGITRAVELPWRFCVAGSRFLSRPVSSWSEAA